MGLIRDTLASDFLKSTLSIGIKRNNYYYWLVFAAPLDHHDHRLKKEKDVMGYQ